MDVQIKQHVVANEEMLQKSKSVYQHSLDMLEVISECRLLAPSRARSCTVVGMRRVRRNRTVGFVPLRLARGPETCGVCRRAGSRATHACEGMKTGA